MAKRERGTTIFSNSTGGEFDPLAQEQVRRAFKRQEEPDKRVVSGSAETEPSTAPEQKSPDDVIEQLFGYHAGVPAKVRSQYLHKLWRMVGMKGEFSERALRAEAAKRLASGDLPSGVIELPPKKETEQDVLHRLEDVREQEAAQVADDTKEIAPAPETKSRVIKLFLDQKVAPSYNDVGRLWNILRKNNSSPGDIMVAKNLLREHYSRILATDRRIGPNERTKYQGFLQTLEGMGASAEATIASQYDQARLQDTDQKIANAKSKQKEWNADNPIHKVSSRAEEIGDAQIASQNREVMQNLKVHPARLSGPEPDTKDRDFTRRASQITLARVPQYEETHPLHAPTEQESDEKFKALTRETWKKDLVAHGILETDSATGELVVRKRGDLDVKLSLGILRLAGIHMNEKEDVEYVAAGESRKGKINIDTGGKHGLVIEDDGETAYFDHHGKESKDEDSAVKFVYKTAVELGLLERQPELDRMVEFVNNSDNMTYPREAYGRNSYNTIVGLGRQLNFDSLYQLFKNHENPTEAIPEAELKKIYVSYEIKRAGRIIHPARTLYEASEQRHQQLEKDWERIAEMEQQGLIIDSPDYGKVIVDIDGTITTGADTAKAYGAGVFIKWMPKNNSFFVSTFGKKLHHPFSQGIPVRGTMWIKARTDKSPLTVKLGDLVGELTGGKAELTGELKQYLEAENPDIQKELELRQLAEETWEEEYEAQVKGIQMTDSEKDASRNSPFIQRKRAEAVRRLIAQFKNQS